MALLNKGTGNPCSHHFQCSRFGGERVLASLPGAWCGWSRQSENWYGSPLTYTEVSQLAGEIKNRNKKPLRLRALGISVARNRTRISNLELGENLQKQIFLSEQICLAFTPRNRPRAGSPDKPWQPGAHRFLRSPSFQVGNVAECTSHGYRTPEQ